MEDQAYTTSFSGIRKNYNMNQVDLSAYDQQ